MTELISIIKSSDNLNVHFQYKFGYVEKMEKLWKENKYLKLLNKLLKVVVTLFKKMTSIKVDDLLALNSVTNKELLSFQ